MPNVSKAIAQLKQPPPVPKIRGLPPKIAEEITAQQSAPPAHPLIALQPEPLLKTLDFPFASLTILAVYLFRMLSINDGFEWGVAFCIIIEITFGGDVSQGVCADGFGKVLV
jgi:hypothetical protein